MRKKLTDEEILAKNKEYVAMAESGEIKSLTALQILMDADGIPKPVQGEIATQFVKFLRGKP